MAVGGKRRALAFYFFVRIWYMLISKCRGEWDLGLCMTSGLANRILLRSADFLFWNVFGRKIRKNSPLRTGIIFASPEVMHRPRSHSPLLFHTENIQQIRTENWNASARRLLNAQSLPHVCRVKITFGLLLKNCFVRTRMISMKCFVNWIPLKYARANQQNPTLP